MNCPKCSQSDFLITEPCPQCGFQGDPAQLERLGNVIYLLSEIGGWVELSSQGRENLRRLYTSQRREIERSVGLRPPVLDVSGATQARLELKKREYALRTVETFFQPRGVEIPAEIIAELTAQAEDFRKRLVDAPSTTPPHEEQVTLACYQFLNTNLEIWQTQGRLGDSVAIQNARQIIQQTLERLEIRMGLRSARLAAPSATTTQASPKPAQTSIATPPRPVVEIPAKPPVPPPPPRPPKPPRQPWTWDRLWDTLISERTLQAMLFIGVALLVAAAVSLIVWNWNAFPPLAQVGFLALFTAIFYGLGWYVRVKLKLRGSGIALSAFASLLVPLEIYAIYLSGGFPAERWAEVWWGASLACLLAYIATTYLIQAEFFGYLVGLAGGSLVCASLQLLGVIIPWWQVGLAVYILLISLAGELLFRKGLERWKIIASPLWLLALTAGAVTLLWNLGLGLTTWRTVLSFRLPLALTWWLGGFLFTFAAGRARSRTFSLAAALIYPLAVLITEAYIFPQTGLGWAWYSLGPALLAPLYLAFGRFYPGEAEKRIPGETALAVGRWLVVIPAIAGMFDVNAAAWVHPWLALTVFLSAGWWQMPRLVFAGGLLLLTGSAGFVAGQGLPWGQIGLAWGLLAVGMVAAGVRLRGKFANSFYASGWLAALFSLLPAVIFFDRGLLVYILGNWTALNGWLALIRHEELSASVETADTSKLGRTLQTLFFLWAAACSLPVWAWQLWLLIRPDWLVLPAVALLLACVFLAWGVWLQRVKTGYATPWFVVGEFCAALGVVLTFRETQNWQAALLMGFAAYAFADARLENKKFILWPACILFPIGLLQALDLAHLLPEAQPSVIALVALAYLLSGWALERWAGWRRDFLLPLYQSLYFLGVAAFGFSLLSIGIHAIQYWKSSDALTLWAAATELMLGIVFALRTWGLKKRWDGYLAAWLGAIAFGLAASAFSHGTGRSAALAALATWGYVLLERSLNWLRRPGKPKQAFFRELSRLFRGPLINTARLLTVATLGLALIRNLTMLEGRTPQIWADVALWLVVGLFAASAWLYYRWQMAPKFVYLAAGLAFLPWSLLQYLIWPKHGLAEYAEGWVVLAALEWLIGAGLMARGGWGRDAHLQRLARPLHHLAHVVLPAALIFNISYAPSASVSFGIGVAFYAACTWLDWRTKPHEPNVHFLYPAVFLAPIWACFVLAAIFPEAQRLAYGALLLAFSLPAFAVARWLTRRQPAYSAPFYWLTYLILLPGTLLVGGNLWALLGALTLCAGVFGLSAWLINWPALRYLAGAWVFLPWTLLMSLLWPQFGQVEYAVSWAVLAALEWLFGLWLLARSKWGQKPEYLPLSRPFQEIAHILLVSALFLSMPQSWSASITFGIGVAFYALCTWLDSRMTKAPQARFLYPAVFLTPVWACFIIRTIIPQAEPSAFAVLLLTFSLPAFGIGRWIARHHPAYHPPFTWLAYLVLAPGVYLAIGEPWLLVGAMLLCTLVFGLSAWLFQRPLWLYPATITLSVAWMVALSEWRVPWNRFGWGLVGLAAGYILAGWGLHRLARRVAKDHLRPYATPLTVAGLLLTMLSLPSSYDALGMFVGYGGAMLICIFCAFWLNTPFFLTPVTLLSAAAYLGLIGLINPVHRGPIWWPWVAALLAGAIWLDHTRGGGTRWNWLEVWRWPVILAKYVWRWWAFPLYCGAFFATAAIGAYIELTWIAAINWLLAGCVYGLAIYLFRRRFWLLTTAVSLQLAAFFGIIASGDGGLMIDLALAFSPVMWVTLLIGLWIEERFGEGAPRGWATWRGWSRPLLALVMADLAFLQLLALLSWGINPPLVMLSNGLALALMASWWQFGALAYLALIQGALVMAQALDWRESANLAWPWAFALLSLAYGVSGYLIKFWKKLNLQEGSKPRWADGVLTWESPLCQGGWLLSWFSLLLALMFSPQLGTLVVRTIFALPLLDAPVVQQVQMDVGVLAILGIFYLTAAVVERWRWLAYGAVALLLGAWSLEWLLVWGQREIQWYVLPTSVYLLAVSYVEWHTGSPASKSFARWLDRAALLLLLGSIFWQSLGDSGGWYALLMGIECLLVIWWGSARRMRRFLYIGLVSMMLNIFGQLINPLLSANRWIVFGVGGAILVGLAILIERRMETVKQISAEVRKRLEEWE